MLKVSKVGMNYKGDTSGYYAIRNISFELEDGENLAIVGGSGCGKTTLLNIIGGLLEPTEGEVTFNGRKACDSEDISIILQDYGLLLWKSVKENIRLPLRLSHQKDKFCLADQVIEKLELKHVASKYPGQLSGGQKQRTAIGRAILSSPKMILMDEPFSALDPMLRKKLNRELKAYFKEKKITVIIVTHSLEEALNWGERILVFNEHRQNRIVENVSKASDKAERTKLKQLVSGYMMGECFDV